jgi:hypothetical protein
VCQRSGFSRWSTFRFRAPAPGGYTSQRSGKAEKLAVNSAIFQKIEVELPIGTRLNPDYHVTGVRESRGENALFYSIPSNKGSKRSQKSIVESEFERAYQYLLDEGEFTVAWFKENMPITASQSTSCSFKVVGEVFAVLGLARRIRSGRGHKYIHGRGDGVGRVAHV